VAFPQQLLVLVVAAALSTTEGRHKKSFNPLSRLTNAAAGVVPVDALLDDVDMNALVERVDLNEQLERIDLNEALARVDMDRLLGQVDLNQLMANVDVESLLDRIDVNALLDRVDADRLLDRVDPDRLLDRVDPNALLDRVDTNKLIAKTDLNAALDRVDLDKVMDRIDVKKVVDRAGIPQIVQESTGHMAESMLDLVRRQVVAIDQVIMRGTLKVGGRSADNIPAGPPGLVGKSAVGGVAPGQVTGHYAGPLSRLAAFVMDSFVVFGAFTLFSVGLAFVFRRVLGEAGWSLTTETLVGLAIFLTWVFLYGVVSLAVAGRTLGMAIIGLRVVRESGSPLKPTQAVVRVLTMPLSFLFLGIGFIGLIFGSRRRALHDIIAGTVVVYDWGDRPAEMAAPLTEWLARKDTTGVSKDTLARSDPRK
jgi:uncharacterized RDD family membrane protein YckC